MNNKVYYDFKGMLLATNDPVYFNNINNKEEFLDYNSSDSRKLKSWEAVKFKLTGKL